MYSRYVKLRDKKGVRDADVASATGIGKSTFTDWKQGRSVPKQEKLQRIADYFEVNIGYFTDENAENNEGYYVNGKTAEIAQAVFDDPDLRLLFDAARNTKPENIRLAAEMLRRFKETGE